MLGEPESRARLGRSDLNDDLASRIHRTAVLCDGGTECDFIAGFCTHAR
ncbi:hypothetical protein NJ7G_1635 [Natrinema sp. J7-2]|nr:hypothetical protein NJ7G_1635 [Natrinema sp. J7-2]